MKTQLQGSRKPVRPIAHGRMQMGYCCALGGFPLQILLQEDFQMFTQVLKKKKTVSRYTWLLLTRKKKQKMDD